jgi:hypothetical protein
VNPLTIMVVGTNARSRAVIVVEHGQAEVALRRGTSESENRNAYAACFTMSSPSAETLSLLDEQDAYSVLSESKRASKALILTYHHHARRQHLANFVQRNGHRGTLKIWSISPTEWISYLVACVLNIPKRRLRGFFANAFKFQDSLQVEKASRGDTSDYIG